MKRMDSVSARSTVKTGPYYAHGGAGGPKDTSAGMDLSKNATNVIQKLGNNPKPVGPTANAAMQTPSK